MTVLCQKIKKNEFCSNFFLHPNKNHVTYATWSLRYRELLNEIDIN